MDLRNSDAAIEADVAKIRSLSIIPLILEVICKITGMGFAAIARVTTEKWVACDVRDEIKFGLLPGGELKLDTTICHEIRQTGDGVVIDSVDKDEVYASHHTPAMYGFKSYISMPIARRDSTFWGTLCAIDPSPAILNTPEIVGMFKVYASLISFHLNAIEQLPTVEVKELEGHTNDVLQEQLTAINEHDLQVMSRDKRNKMFIGILDGSSSRITQLMEQLKAIAA
jgi:GAF domain-containing protein